MSTIAIYYLDLSSEWNLLAEDPKHWSFVDYSPPKCMLCLKTDDQYRISGVGSALSQVMQDAACLCHA